MSDDLRSRVIRLAHQNPSLRPHLLPLLKQAATAHFAAVRQPKSGVPVYEGNAMALPLNWGSIGRMTSGACAHYMVPLFNAAKNGVAYVLDENGVFTAAGLPAIEKALRSDLVNSFYSQIDYAEEYYQSEGPEGAIEVDAVFAKAERAAKLRVSITPITSPSSGKSGLKVVFRPTAEQINTAV